MTKSAPSTVPQESRLSKTLSENNQRNVILLVLVILFSIPFFSVSNYVSQPNVHQYSINLLSSFDTNSQEFNETLDGVIAHYGPETHHQILALYADGVFWAH